ncbi:DMT family transporter [Phytohalomonas tamaricis]|uniref:DMT family transporter n=1 Tax=Phytohalomonas tamaricis TaxID=2081032 RepID=UPI000D0B19B5|nr:SMR family transporter [Phytohalomonas tamaricis]
MAWLALIVSGLFEIVGVAGFERFSRGRPGAGLLLLTLGFGTSLTLLSFAMRSIDLGVAYAVFTAIGTLGSTTLGMLLWGESRRPARLFFVALIVVAVIGLRLVS